MSVLGLIPFIVIFGLFIALVIFIGVYVYKDAPQYGLDPLIWTLIAVFIPNLIGFIIYLIVRSGRREKYTCPNCGKQVQNDFKKCPYCDAELLNKCLGCGKQLNADWETCPYCGAKVEKAVNYGTVNYAGTSSRNRNKGLIAIIVIFIVLILAVVSIFALNFIPYKYNHNVKTISVEKDVPMEIESSKDDNILLSMQSTYGFWEENNKKEIQIDKDGELKINYNSIVDSGSLEISLLDSDGNVIEDLPVNESGTYISNVKEGDIYYIEVIGNKTKGMYDLQIEQVN